MFAYCGQIVIESPQNINSFFVYCDVFSLADVPESNLLDVKVQFLKMKDRVLDYPVHRGMPKEAEGYSNLNISIRVEGEDLPAEKFRDILEGFIDCSLNTKKQLRVVSMGRIIYNP